MAFGRYRNAKLQRAEVCHSVLPSRSSGQPTVAVAPHGVPQKGRYIVIPQQPALSYRCSCGPLRGIVHLSLSPCVESLSLASSVHTSSTEPLHKHGTPPSRTHSTTLTPLRCRKISGVGSTTCLPRGPPSLEATSHFLPRLPNPSSLSGVHLPSGPTLQKTSHRLQASSLMRQLYTTRSPTPSPFDLLAMTLRST